MTDPIDDVITSMYENHVSSPEAAETPELIRARQDIWLLVGIIIGLRVEAQKAKA